MVAVALNETLIHAREMDELLVPGMKLDAHTTLVVPSYDERRDSLDDKITRQDSGYEQIEDLSPQALVEREEATLRREDAEETSSDSGLNEENLDEEEFEEEEDRLVMMDENVVDVDGEGMIDAENRDSRHQPIDGQVLN